MSESWLNKVRINWTTHMVPVHALPCPFIHILSFQDDALAHQPIHQWGGVGSFASQMGIKALPAPALSFYCEKKNVPKSLPMNGFASMEASEELGRPLSMLR